MSFKEYLKEMSERKDAGYREDLIIALEARCGKLDSMPYDQISTEDLHMLAVGVDGVDIDMVYEPDETTGYQIKRTLDVDYR